MISERYLRELKRLLLPVVAKWLLTYVALLMPPEVSSLNDLKRAEELGDWTALRHDFVVLSGVIVEMASLATGATMWNGCSVCYRLV